MNMKYKLTALTLIMTLSTIMMSPAIAAAQSSSNANHKSAPLSIPVSGASKDGSGSFAGTFNLQRVVVGQDGKLAGIGTLIGTFTKTGGEVQNIVIGGVSMPLTASTRPAPLSPQQASALQPSGQQTQEPCDILHLVLGPLHLDLLGLVIDLNEVHLDIVAQPGPGNLLGNLLCAIAGLLNGSGTQQAIANLLNQILNLLG
jgi:hypothetical protein